MRYLYQDCYGVIWAGVVQASPRLLGEVHEVETGAHAFNSRCRCIVEVGQFLGYIGTVVVYPSNKTVFF